MSSFFAAHPFLPSARARAERLGIRLEDITDEELEIASARLRSILSGRPDYSILDERTELLHYVIFRIFVSFLGSEYYYGKLGRFYAERTRRNFSHDIFTELGIDPYAVPLSAYMKYRHIYPETKIYHVELKRGVVYLTDALLPLFAGCTAYTLSVAGLPLDVSGVPERFAEYAKRSVAVRRAPRSSRGYGYIEAVLSASGIPDGRKRIIFYWLAPYLVTVKGLSPDEAISTINEWLSRQGGGRIQPSWVKDEVLLAKRKGIRPWSLKKVRERDPGLVDILEGMGVLR